MSNDSENKANDNKPSSPMVFYKPDPINTAQRKIKRNIYRLENLMRDARACVDMDFRSFNELTLWREYEHPRQLAAYWSGEWRERLYGHYLRSRNGYIDP